MKTLEIQNVLKQLPRISITDPDHAADEIVPGVIKSGVLYYDDHVPVLRMKQQYRRLKAAEEETVIFCLLDAKSQCIVPTRQIREAAKRLCCAPSLQIDLTQSFWDGQLYVNVKNGVYSIERQAIVTLQNPLLFDYQLGFNYRPHCKLEAAPSFKRFVESSIGTEQLECLLRVLGYNCSSLTKGRKAFVFYGHGRTGKSTILNVLESVIGEGLVSHEPFHAMSSERAKAHYEGKRVNISRETSTKVNRHEESFKSLISCEYTTGSEKFEKQRDFVATLSFLFAGNTDIEFASMDDAILDRLVYLMFTQEIPAEDLDPDLETKLLEERDIIFSLALDSLKGLIRDNYDFKMSKASEEHLRQRRFLIHSAESFLEESCRLTADGKVSKVALYSAYTAFCSANALKPLGRNTFYDKVRSYHARITDGRSPDEAGNSVQGFHGLELTISKQKAGSTVERADGN